MGHLGWPRYEVRPMDSLELESCFDVVATNLSFQEADRLRKEKEASDD